MAKKSRRSATGSASQRQLRMGELVRHALSEVLQRGELRDPVLHDKMIMLPEVRMSPDMRYATIYALPVGSDNAEEVVKALNRSSRFLRGQLGRMIEAQFVPELKFLKDGSYDEASHIDELLNRPEVLRDLANDKSSITDPDVED
ncbi:MAG: ribosome-binding factor A [Hyphomicrobiales bacterium]|nr:MAG: ribosome-binding factor A [Hyphomicrobiales bacterium]